MPRIKVPMMVDDVRFARLGQGKATENVEIEGDFFLDGPVTRRVAVIDLDADSGALQPGARFIPARRGQTFGKYDIPAPIDFTSRPFNQVSVFATIFKTMQLYEKSDTLGRPISWAFNSPQLLVVPRAGLMENAFYDRQTHSLHFFYFPDHTDPSNTIFTSLARDVVAHETGHAILDGIAPHLWNAITPQSLALHEAVGDLTALLASLESDHLVNAVLRETNGSIKYSTHFSAIAEDFGMGRGTGALRDLLNDTKLSDLMSSDPHDLCVVLTGALYKVLYETHEKYKHERMVDKSQSEYSASGWALFRAGSQLRRMAFRALDYLPPGEVSFADYGRAIIAADRASHPDAPDERNCLVEEFVTRGIVPDAQALEAGPPDDDLAGLDLAALAESDWAAYAFANSERGHRLLGIPPDRPFQIEPRLAVEKLYYHGPDDTRGRKETVREILFKVWWYEEEPNPMSMGMGLPAKRRITVGTTLSWDKDTGRPRVRLTSARDQRPAEQAEQQAARDEMLRKLSEQGVLRDEKQALAPDGRDLSGVIKAGTRDGELQIQGGARMLHLVGEG